MCRLTGKAVRYLLHLTVLMQGFFLWINGQKAGYSVNSRNVAEFDITKYVKPGKNMVAAEVYRYNSGSYLEDQDMWRLSGIFRNVTIWSSPQQHIRDFFVKTDLDDNYVNANVEVLAKVKNYGSKAAKASKLTATLYNGEAVVASANGNVPALKPGEEVSVKLSFPVQNPDKWTAETPKLYTTVLDPEKTVIKLLKLSPQEPASGRLRSKAGYSWQMVFPLSLKELTVMRTGPM